MTSAKAATSQIGMWHRPFEKNLADVKRTLSELHTLGVTDLFVETYFNGQLIFPSNHALLPMHAFIEDYGPYKKNLLKAFVDEGKQLNIRIHAWVENFFIGRFDHIQDCPWIDIHEDWILKNRDGSYLQKNEVNYVFLDPANRDVTSYITLLYKDILNVLGVATLHLDYIRYPLMYQIYPPMISDDVGYNQKSLDAFAKTYHIEGSIKDQLQDPNTYQTWCDYRIHIIDQFVHDIYELANENHTGLSAAVFGDPNHAIKHKMQDWYTWLKNGWLDIILPMAYYKDDKRVYEEVKRMKEMIPKGVTLMAGIAPLMMKLTLQDHQDQIYAALNAGADGVAMFASQHYLSHHFMGQDNPKDEMIKLFTSINLKEMPHETMD